MTENIPIYSFLKLEMPFYWKSSGLYLNIYIFYIVIEK